MATWDRTGHSESPEAIATISSLGDIYRSQGKYAEAEPLLRRVLANKEKTLGPDHLDVATSANDLALLYNCEEKYADAAPLYKKAIQIREKNLGVGHPDVVRTREIYAVLLRQEGRKADARETETGPAKIQLNNFQSATP